MNFFIFYYSCFLLLLTCVDIRECSNKTNKNDTRVFFKPSLDGSWLANERSLLYLAATNKTINKTKTTTSIRFVSPSTAAIIVKQPTILSDERLALLAKIVRLELLENKKYYCLKYNTVDFFKRLCNI